MKIIEVKQYSTGEGHPEPGDISAWFDLKREDHFIDIINWANYGYKPEVRFNICYTGNEIWLRYSVRENYFKAEMSGPNQRVWEDSCVEFFISPGEDDLYYNFEFNAIGTCLLAAGTERNNRIPAQTDIIKRIEVTGSSGAVPFPERQGESFWTLTLAIPFDVFFLHKINDLKGRTLKANFYKCGDKLTIPHYLTWNPVKTANPDFHQPAHFGLLKFV